MPKILKFFGSICKYFKKLTLLSVVYPSSDSLGQVPQQLEIVPCVAMPVNYQC